MGIMGKNNTIKNIPIHGSLFLDIKNIFKEKLGIDIIEVVKVSENKNVYMVTIPEEKHLRLDLEITYSPKRFIYQELAYKNNINVPKILTFFEYEKGICKISEWIEGIRIGYFWEMLETFEKSGELIAKVNNLQDIKSGNNLTVVDFSKPNAVLTEGGEVYIVDVLFAPTPLVNEYVADTLKRIIVEPLKIEAFLKGYTKYRDCANIIKILEGRIDG